jgi:DNA invertase Pin-like site-specific DNA recombinase
MSYRRAGKAAARALGFDECQQVRVDILALIAEFENDIRRERQMDGIAKAKERGTRFGRKPELTPERVSEIKSLRQAGTTVPNIMRLTGFSKSSVSRALGSEAA